MSRIDNVFIAIPAMTETKHAVWAANAARVIAHAPSQNPACANALRLRDAIAAFDTARPTKEYLIPASGLDWDRTTFCSFDGDHLVTPAALPRAA